MMLIGRLCAQREFQKGIIGNWIDIKIPILVSWQPDLVGS